MRRSPHAMSSFIVLLACSVLPSAAHAATPDVAVFEVRAPDYLFIGRSNDVSADIGNIGSAAALGFHYRVVLSKTNTINLYDDVMLQTGPISLAASANATLENQIWIPETIPPGEYFVGYILDPGATLQEANRLNNAMPTAHVSMVREPAPDLVVSEVRVGAKGAAGETLRVNFTVENRGNMPAEFDYAVYLSHNEIISASDILLFRGVQTLGEGEARQISDYVVLPPGLPVGTYFVGVIADPDDEIEELNEEGNTGRSSSPIEVGPASLWLATSWVPEAIIGEDFAWRFVAMGGTGDYEYALIAGELPPGMALNGELGEIAGVPAEPGEWAIVLEVRSGGLAVSAGYVLRVVRPSISLTINTDSLTPAIHQRDYRMSLSAVGGQPPYVWSASALPAGLELDDDGLLHGAPTSSGSFSVEFRVRDQTGYSVRRTLGLRVVERGSLTILTGLLPPGMVGEGYPPIGMEAMGATGFITWSIVDGAMPPGIALEAESGIIRGVPLDAGRFHFKVRARDEAGLVDINGYIIEVLSQPLSIVTQDTAPATVGVEYRYSFQLMPGSGRAPYEWRLLSGALPEGLGLDAQTAEISGVPAPGSEGLHTFGLQVSDAAGARGMRAYILEVYSSENDQKLSIQPEPPGGCESVAGGGLVAMASVLFFSAFFASRRRLRSFPLGLAALMALASGCSAANPCEGVVCEAGMVCSQGDGECRCGGPGGELCGDDETCDPVSGFCHPATNLCEGLVCGDGLGCDPDDGLCKCGGAGGWICAEDQWCDPLAGRCVSPDPCDQVDCAGEELCDSSTGQCVCGDSPGCPVGERCSSGECVADFCYGVTCTGGNICDPADGVCRCGGAGGAECGAAEVCNPSSSECLPAASCAGVVCAAGLSCDPSDGLCKCGGTEGFDCEIDQFCDPLAGVCLGGDPCVDVVCTAGTTCDPEDGMCRCGGHGGLVCEAGEWCVEPFGQERLCSPSCSPVFQDCRDDAGCYYDEASDKTFCTRAGSAGEGSFCNVSPDCEAGLHCADEGTSRRCRQLCDTAAAYPQPGSCHLQSYCDPAFPQRAEIGICVSTGG